MTENILFVLILVHIFPICLQSRMIFFETNQLRQIQVNKFKSERTHKGIRTGLFLARVGEIPRQGRRRRIPTIRRNKEGHLNFSLSPNFCQAAFVFGAGKVALYFLRGLKSPYKPLLSVAGVVPKGQAAERHSRSRRRVAGVTDSYAKEKASKSQNWAIAITSTYNAV